MRDLIAFTTPLMRSTIGFDRFNDLFESMSKRPTNEPIHNHASFFQNNGKLPRTGFGGVERSPGADQTNVVSAPSSAQQTAVQQTVSGSAANANPQSAAANAKVADQTQQQAAEKRKQITDEAMVAISETSNALKALDEGKTQDALAALEKTTGKLELILARDPQLTLAPTNVDEVMGLTALWFAALAAAFLIWPSMHFRDRI